MGLLRHLFARSCRKEPPKKTWYFLGHGEWHGPFAFKAIRRITKKFKPGPYVMAGGVTDEEFAIIMTYPQLTGIALVSPNLTVRSTEALPALPQLRELIICGPQITDDFLFGLRSITSLKTVTLIHTSCTRDGVRQLHEILPAFSIYRADAHSILPAALRCELKLFDEDDS